MITRNSLFAAWTFAKHKLTKHVLSTDPAPIAFERQVISKGQLRPCRKAVYDRDQLDRVKDSPFESTPEREFQALEATQIQDRDTVLLTARSVLLLGGWLFRGYEAEYLSQSSAYRALLNRIEELGTAALASSLQGTKFFGHWLRDDCSSHLLASEFGPTRTLPTPDWRDKDFYTSAFGLVERPLQAAWIDRLHMISDLGFNIHKRNRINELRSRLDKQAPVPDASDIVYLKRGPTGAKREMTNEGRLITELRRAGVKIASPEGNTEALVQTCRRARILISIEGSQLAHGVYSLPEGGALLVLQPPDRFYNPHLEWCRLINRSYGLVIGHLTPGGFRIEPDEVLRMIDQLLGVQERDRSSTQTLPSKIALTAA